MSKTYAVRDYHRGMRSIGIRAEPRSFYWAVTEGDLEVPILLAVGRVEAPEAYSFPNAANFLRLRLQQLLREHSVDVAGLRTPEMMRSTTESIRERIRIEGTLLATCAEAGIEVTQGALATLNRLLGARAKELLASPDYRGIDFAKMVPAKREAILMSASLLRSRECKS